MNKYTQRLEKIEVVLNKNLPELFDKAMKERLFLQLPEAINEKHNTKDKSNLNNFFISIILLYLLY